MTFPIHSGGYMDVPAAGSTQTHYAVSAFGAVEPGSAGALIRQEWSPTTDGCFTKWWESPDLPQQRYGRYNPPWEFDRIDRRTTIYIAQTKAIKGRFSDRAFLYRRGDVVVGICWPNLLFRRSQGRGAMQFRHVFGRCDDAARTVTELICVDTAGHVWEFADAASAFGLEPGNAMYPHDHSHAPKTANDWLRHNVYDVESVLTRGRSLEPRRIEPK